MKENTQNHHFFILTKLYFSKAQLSPVVMKITLLLCTYTVLATGIVNHKNNYPEEPAAAPAIQLNDSLKIGEIANGEYVITCDKNALITKLENILKANENMGNIEDYHITGLEIVAQTMLDNNETYYMLIAHNQKNDLKIAIDLVLAEESFIADYSLYVVCSGCDEHFLPKKFMNGIHYCEAEDIKYTPICPLPSGCNKTEMIVFD